MRIHAAIAWAGAPFRIEACELDAPREHEVLVEVEACGICHTDLAARDGEYGTPLPAVLGHEGVGRILRVGDGVYDFAAGDRVLMSFGACGQCPNCRARFPGYCRHAADFNGFGRRIDGASPILLDGWEITGHFFGQSSFASHAIAAATNLVHLPEDLPAAPMTALACGVQTGVGAVINVLGAFPGDSIAIFGCGTVGLAAVMAARIAGCGRIVAIDLRAERLALAHELGATEVIDNSELLAGVALDELRGLTMAFDNTGDPAMISAAYASLGARGRLVLAGVSPRGTSLTFDANRLMSTGRTVRGTIEGDADPPRFIPQLIEWYRRGELPVDRLIEVYPFAQINEAAADMVAGRVVKAVLSMSGRHHGGRR